jgi:hypothetical protein
MTTTMRDVLTGGNADARADVTQQLSAAGGALSLASKAVQLSEVTELIWQMLDLPLDDLMSRAWDSHALVQKAKSSTRDKPGAMEQVHLSKHTIRSAHRPKIEVEMVGASLPAMEFDLALTISVDAAVLSVADGRVTEIRPGQTSAAGTFTAAGKTLLEGNLAKVSLPGVIAPPTDKLTR